MEGLEPSTAGFVDRCSIQLSYTRSSLKGEPIKGGHKYSTTGKIIGGAGRPFLGSPSREYKANIPAIHKPILIEVVKKVVSSKC